jgi:hypothetical protein
MKLPVHHWLVAASSRSFFEVRTIHFMAIEAGVLTISFKNLFPLLPLPPRR